MCVSDPTLAKVLACGRQHRQAPLDTNPRLQGEILPAVLASTEWTAFLFELRPGCAKIGLFFCYSCIQEWNYSDLSVLN